MKKTNINELKCKKKRSLFNLFEVFSCNNCIKKREDEVIPIGGINVNIYYLDNNCVLDDLDDESIAFSPKLRIFLKDAIYNNHNNIIIWLSESSLDNDNLEGIYELVSFDEDIHILNY